MSKSGLQAAASVAALIMLAGCNQGNNQAQAPSVAPFLKTGETICIDGSNTGKVLAVSGDFVKLEPRRNGKFLPKQEMWGNVRKMDTIQKGACQQG